MSKQPPALPSLNRVKRQDEIITETREYTVITPIYGGGVDAGKPDEVTPIRVPTIRGHLRFWWRATRGAACKNTHDLHAKESAIWGSTEQPSCVQITVEMTQASKPFTLPSSIQHHGQPVQNIGHFKSPYSYAAFPAQSEPIFEPLWGHQFKLTLRYPSSLKAEVEAALWAWSCFGWIGARGRRGFGALQLRKRDGVEVKYPEKADKLCAKLQEELKHYALAAGGKIEMPILHGARLRCIGENKQAEAIWSNLLQRYKNFRQQRNQGTHPTPGRSKWPEPDAIRAITRQSAPAHRAPVVHVSGKVIRRFPRAFFGLPIIFHFKQGREPEKKGEPSDVELRPFDWDRMASPLILRPFHTGSNVVGMALVLRAPFPFADDLLLNKSGSKDKQSARVTPQEAQAIVPLNGETDPLQAFLNSLK